MKCKPSISLDSSFRVLLLLFALPCSGHNDLLEKVFSVVQKEKGLHLGGNYRTGASIGDCIQFGKDIANEIRISLTSMP